MNRASATPFDEASWLALEPAPGETLRTALERALRGAIRAGALRAGVKLPASRALARSLGISRGVVSDAYGQLEAQGFLVVRSRAAPVVGVAADLVAAPLQAEPVEAPPRYDLTPTSPDVTLFPLRRWLTALHKVGRTAPVAKLDYCQPRGEPALRAALADHLGRTRGVVADPRTIVVVQGAAQGIDVVLRVLAARGAKRIAVEDPSHATQHERIRRLGLELVPCPVDADGIVVDRLDDADAVIVTPAHQFPLGAVLSGERRRELLAWSQRSGGLIVEDDYDSEFRYDREAVRSLQGLASEHVVQVGTVSKTLAPGLRLGWLVLPSALADEAERMKRLVDDFSPSLDQLCLAELLRNGDYDRHVRRARAVYRRRRDRLLAVLAERLPGLPVEGVAAGLHVVLWLPPGVRDVEVARTAADSGIRVAPVADFRIRRSRRNGLVVGYGRVHESAIEAAVRGLALVIAAHAASVATMDVRHS